MTFKEFVIKRHGHWPPMVPGQHWQDGFHNIAEAIAEYVTEEVTGTSIKAHERLCKLEHNVQKLRLDALDNRHPLTERQLADYTDYLNLDPRLLKLEQLAGNPPYIMSVDLAKGDDISAIAGMKPGGISVVSRDTEKDRRTAKYGRRMTDKPAGRDILQQWRD